MKQHTILNDFIKYASLNVLGMIGLSCYILADTFFISIQSQIRSIRQEKLSGDNIYQLLLAFDEVYGSASEA